MQLYIYSYKQHYTVIIQIEIWNNNNERAKIVFKLKFLILLY